MSETAGSQPAPAPAGARAGGGRMTTGKVVLVVFGALFVAAGFVSLLGGGVLVWAHATQRDAHGFYNTSTKHFFTSTYALTSTVDLGDAPGEHEWTFTHPVGTIRVRATGRPGQALFVGIGRRSAVEQWLSGVAHERVRGANFGPFHTDTSVVSGSRPLAVPGYQRFWAASSSGTGTQTLLWPSEGGRWTMVVANADASRGVDARVKVGARTGVLLPIGIGALAFGMVLLAGGSVMMFFGLRHQVAGEAPVPGARAAETPGPAGALASAAPPSTAPPSSEPPAGAAPSYPARLEGRLDPDLSRWMWLVKWFLAIPHVVVLVFLWIAAAVLTVVAGFAILFTERYPRSIFDFNVGVMRWTWRVGFYAYSVAGTDRYPPFNLRADPAYPADLDVAYPEQLSRGLVLVKWWLLAIPHYVVEGIFAGGWTIWWPGNSGWGIQAGGGLISFLVLVGVVVLLFRGRYPDGVFDLVMGLNRWVFRVVAYAALMRDEYPPFRLDSGGRDPASP